MYSLCLLASLIPQALANTGLKVLLPWKLGAIIFEKKKSFIMSLRGGCELTKGVKHKTGGSCSSQRGSLAKSLVHLSVIEEGLGKASNVMGIMFCLCNLCFKALPEVWAVPRGAGWKVEWVFPECCWPREMQREKLWVRASSSIRGGLRLWATTWKSSILFAV